MPSRQWFIDRSDYENMTSDFVKWKTTPGIGDLQMGMNMAYFRSQLLQKPITVELHWYHGKHYLYHFEDPETILERFKYINSMMIKEKTDVTFKHKFFSNDAYVYTRRAVGYNQVKWGHPRIRDCEWLMKGWDEPREGNKIVVWRSTFNAQLPRRFKRTFDGDIWLQMFDILREQGYEIQEIDYRTPIREVFFHLRTCICTVSYEGMWHYVAKNLCTPMIVITRDKVTKRHTPHALIYNIGPPDSTRFSMKYFFNFSRRLERARLFAEQGRNYIREMIHDESPPDLSNIDSRRSDSSKPRFA